MFIFQSYYGAIYGSSMATDTADVDQKSGSKIALQYGSSLQQNGRKTTASEPFIHSSFLYSHKSGLSAGFSSVLMPTAKKKIVDNVAINLGYDKDLSENISVGLDYSYSHYFTTKQLTASQPHTLMANAMCYNTIITPSFYVIGGFGKTSDLTLNLDLMHVFIIHRVFTSTDKFTFPIIASLYAGTTHYYSDYLSKNNVKSKSSTISNNPNFALSSLNFMVSAKYRIACLSIGCGVNYDYQLSKTTSVETSNAPVININSAVYF